MQLGVNLRDWWANEKKNLIPTLFSRYSKTVRFPRTVSILALSGIVNLGGEERERDTQKEGDQNKSHTGSYSHAYLISLVFSENILTGTAAAAAEKYESSSCEERLNSLRRVQMFFFLSAALRHMMQNLACETHGEVTKKKNTLFEMMCWNYLCIQTS